MDFVTRGTRWGLSISARPRGTHVFPNPFADRPFARVNPSRTVTEATMTAIEWTNRLFRHGGARRMRCPLSTDSILRERLVSIGDDFPIEGGEGEPAFSVDGRALRTRSTLIVRDLRGNDLYGSPSGRST